MFKQGDKVTYSNYGATREGVVSHMSRDGKIVFLIGGKWLHAISVAKG
jgi:hypothetical protein